MGDIVDCNVNHFLYIVSLVIEQLNRDKFENNANNDVQVPLYQQMKLLTYLLENKMDGYSFKEMNNIDFQSNVQKLVIDGEKFENAQYSMEYAAMLHYKIDQFDISTIDKQSNCSIQVQLSNMKKWEFRSADEIFSLLGIDIDVNIMAHNEFECD